MRCAFVKIQALSRKSVSILFSQMWMNAHMTHLLVTLTLHVATPLVLMYVFVMKDILVMENNAVVGGICLAIRNSIRIILAPHMAEW